MIRCTANCADVVGAVVAGGEPAAVDADRVDDPFAARRRGCRRTRSARSRPASTASRRAASEPIGVSSGDVGARAGATRSPAPDRGDDLGQAGLQPGVLGTPRRCRGSCPAPVGAGDVDGAVDASTSGETPSSRSRGSSTSSGVVLTRTVGAIRRSPSESARGWCSTSVSAVSSSARRNASAWPTRDGAERPRGVVDQVGQRLRDRRARHGSRNACTSCAAQPASNARRTDDGVKR